MKESLRSGSWRPGIPDNEALSNIADNTPANITEFFDSDRCTNEVCYKCGKITDCKQLHNQKCF